MRLIDADALIEQVERSRIENPHGNPIIGMNHYSEHLHFYHMIAQQATAFDIQDINRRIQNAKEDCPFADMEKIKAYELGIECAWDCIKQFWMN